MREICGNCKHNKYDRTGKNGGMNGCYYCGNEESDEYGVPTMYDDTCDSFEDKTERERI